MATDYLKLNENVLAEIAKKEGKNSAKYRTLVRYLECQTIYARELEAGKKHHEAWQAAADHWNTWANDLLKKRKRLEGSGQWQAEKNLLSGLLTGKNEATQQWLDEAEIDFSRIILIEHEKSQAEIISGNKENSDNSNIASILCYILSFANFVFPQDAWFNHSKFYGLTRFEHVKFYGFAWFRGVKFYGNNWFGGAKFYGYAWFEHGHFYGVAGFWDVQFHGGAGFKHSQFHGDAGFEDAQFHGDAGFEDAQFHGDSGFGGAQFHGDAGFEDAQFHGDAGFEGAQFHRDAGFGNAQFHGDAGFEHAQFHGNTWFEHARFYGDTEFEDALFHGNAWFEHTQFHGNAGFRLATFERPVRFDSTRFEGEADFSSIQSKRSFSLHGARFKKVPDFNEAHFHEPPVLDDIATKDQLTEKGHLFRSVERPEENAKTISRNFRKLGKMAHEGRDWLNEMEFFAQEIRTRRFGLDCPFGPNSGRFWFGLFYEKFSNFGRSMARPLLHWLALSLVFFPLLYLLLAQEDTTWWHPLAWLGFVILTMTSIYFWASRERRRTVRAFMRTLLSLKRLPRGVIRILYPLVVPFHLLGWPVVIGWLYSILFLPAGFWQTFSDKWDDALMLSLRQGLVVPGLVRNSHYQNTLERLFGSDLPHSVALALMAQTVLSLICFFFFFLALRNHFRIR